MGGISTHSVAALLTAAGVNPERLRPERLRQPLQGSAYPDLFEQNDPLPLESKRRPGRQQPGAADGGRGAHEVG